MIPINERLKVVTGGDIDLMIQTSQSLGLRMAKAKARFNFLTEMRKVVLASEAEKLRGLYGGAAQNRLENMARAGTVYKEHLTDTHDAEIEHLELQAQYYASKASIEAQQAKIQFAKAEMFHNK